MMANLNAKTFLISTIALTLGFSFYGSNSFAAPKNAEIVVDVNTGEILYEDNASAKRYPASITKVMTLYMLFEAIEAGHIKFDDQIYFSKNASFQKPTKLGVKAGSSISVETAIQALVIKSANDVAVAIAEHIAGSEGNFAKLMTEKAHQIGMINSNFANASGLPNPKQISTAEDLSKLAIAIRRDFPMHYHWFGRESFVFNGVKMNNHNHLVGKIDGVDGLKTGFTSASGYNLATTSVRDGKMIVTVVLGGKTWRSRDARVTELIETAYAQAGIQSQTAQMHNPYQFSFSNYRDEIDIQALLVDASFGQKSNQYSTNIYAEEKPNLKFNKPFIVAIKDGSISENSKSEDEAENEIETPIPAAINISSEKISTPTETVMAIVKPIQALNNNIIENSPEAEKAKITSSFEIPEFTLKGTNESELKTIQLPPADEVKEVEMAQLPNFELPKENLSENSMVKIAQIDSLSNNLNKVEEIPADLAKIIADEEKSKQEEKARLLKLQALKREEAKIAEKKSADKAKQLAAAKAIEDRAIAAKIEKERQIALLNQRGNVVVQVGAFKAKNEAQATILKLAKSFPKFAKSEVSTTKTASGTWFRARFSGLAIESAKKACSIVEKNGAVCKIISM